MLQKKDALLCNKRLQRVIYMQQKINIAICKPFLFQFFGFD